MVSKQHLFESLRVDGGQTEMQDLPDDCLLHLFDYLDVNSLISMASTCTRLQGIACRVFKLHAKKNVLDMRKLLESSFVPNKMHGLTRLFTTFGRFISELSLDFSDRYYEPMDEFEPLADPILKLIAEHCDGEHLRSLRLCDFASLPDGNENGSGFGRLLERLERIRLEYCDDVPAMLSASKELVDIHLKGCANLAAFTSYEFPKLKSFSSINGPDVEMGRFLRRHENLRVLKMSTWFGMDLSAIGRLASLEVLHLYMHTEDIGSRDPNRLRFDGLERLSKLKELHLECEGSRVSRFLNESASAESMRRLAIDDCVVDDGFFDGLVRFRKINQLKLIRIDLTDRRFVQMRFDELTELIFEDSSRMTEAGIKQLVAAHPKLQVLTFTEICLPLSDATCKQLADICRAGDRRLTIKVFQIFFIVDFGAGCINRGDPQDTNYDKRLFVRYLQRNEYFTDKHGKTYDRFF